MSLIYRILKSIFLPILNKGQMDYLLSLKRFNFHLPLKNTKPFFIYFADGSNWHGGLTDRFKGIVSCFAFCKEKNIEFKIFYNYPFKLEDYLTPNNANWLIEKKDISYSIFNSRIINLIGDATLDRLMNLSVNKQIHCFANRDILELINNEFQTEFNWGVLFNELFKPKEPLKGKLEKYKSLIGQDYIGTNFRFQNLLGDFSEYEYKELNSFQKKKLITQCRNELLNLQKRNNSTKILVTADSNLFLESVKDLDNIHAFGSPLQHIESVSLGETHNIDFNRSFVDFYLLSEAKKIYSIGTNQMYKSEFPLYAAKLNNIPFFRILIKE